MAHQFVPDVNKCQIPIISMSIQLTRGSFQEWCSMSIRLTRGSIQEWGVSIEHLIIFENGFSEVFKLEAAPEVFIIGKKRGK